MSTKELKDLFPLWKIEGEALLARHGDATLGYRISLPELFTLSDEDYRHYHQTWVKAIRMLPPGYIVHKQDYFTEAGYRPPFASDAYLSHCSDRFFFERPYLDHRCMVWLTRRYAGKPLASSAMSGLLRKSLAPPEMMEPKAMESFRDTAGQFARILQDGGLSVQSVSADALTGDRKHPGHIADYLYLGQPGLCDITFKPDLKIGPYHCLLYTLADAGDLPLHCQPENRYEPYSTGRTDCFTGFASSLGALLPCNHIYNQYIVTTDTRETLKRLESKRIKLQSLSAYSRENAIARDATADFLNEAISESRQPVKVHYHLLAWTDEKKQVKELRNLIASALAKLDTTPRLEILGAPQLYWAGIPGNAGSLPDNETFDTFAEQACCFLVQDANYKHHPGAKGIRLGDRLTGRPLEVDISDAPMKRGLITNRNKFILGPSGSGKSFFTNHMVRAYYEQGTHIVLVDVGHSYQGLCHLVGGYYFTYREEEPIRFNPFYMENREAPGTEKKESIKTLLLALWKKGDEAYTRSEYVALSNALTHYYTYLAAHPGVFPCFDSFYEFLEIEYADILKSEGVKEKDFDMANFLYVLRPYYQGGEFDFLLNARENLDLLQQRFIVFELDNIKDHPILFPVVTIIIMEIFIAKMRRLKGVRKMILIEEAWKAIAREGMAEYIRYLFKTVRKFYGEAVVVTQEVEDIISSPVVKQAIINNSDTKILLDQSKYRNKFDDIQALLGLTDKEKAQVLSINRANEAGRLYKEVFISLGGQESKVYRTEVSYEEYLTYTTEESEKMALQQLTDRLGGDLQRAISALASERT
ncbi:TraG family conjugative transposon ATPase [Roseivirga sp. BDSF3-8]|uniref:TraG family conjugative transposon ATPase n=1 Tax=Roseivirga sp. BDSF3-8 TaxID=3241598 RepID=UPI003531C0D6